MKYDSPLLLAPIGVQGIVHPEAELATARAAANAGVPMILSTASTRSIEEVAEANENGQRWYQLYWPKDPEVTRSLLSRAKQAGYTALVVTLDTLTIGWRPHDLDTSYLPFGHGTGCAVGASDPVFMKKMGLEVWPRGKHVEFPYEPSKLDERYMDGDEEIKLRVKIGAGWLAEVNSGTYKTWDDLKLLRELWDGPIVLKGIQTVAVCMSFLSSFACSLSLIKHRMRRLRSTGSMGLLSRTTVCWLRSRYCLIADKIHRWSSSRRRRRLSRRSCENMFFKESLRGARLWQIHGAFRLRHPHRKRYHEGDRSRRAGGLP